MGNKEIRKRFFAALRKLRKQGLIVRSAVSTAYNYQSDMQDNPDALGVVWAYRDHREKRGEPLCAWLSYAERDAEGECVKVGAMVLRALIVAGLVGMATWSGKGSDCIIVEEADDVSS